MLIRSGKSNFSKLRILFIQGEFAYWSWSWSYLAHLGFEEGLLANGVEMFTLLSHWLPWAKEICGKRKFDQVWLNDLVHLDADETFMQWVSSLAPVRLAFSIESLKYTPEEYAVLSGFKSKEEGIAIRLKYVTHAVTSDEQDADGLNSRGNLSAIWAPAAVPERFIFQKVSWKQNQPAAFYGDPHKHKDRQKLLGHPVLKALIINPPSPDEKTLDPFFFNFLSRTVHGFDKFRFPKGLILPLYPPDLYLLRQIHRKSFVRYLRSLRNYCAVVNLPSSFKTYSGRVAEGMTACCPVISWHIPNRPRNQALFIDDKEILLFDKDNPEQLARQIKRLKTEPGLAFRLIENSKQKMLRLHTMEKRVGQILEWLETAKEPTYE